jgi:Ca-activated chloride channel family protein
MGFLWSGLLALLLLLPLLVYLYQKFLSGTSKQAVYYPDVALAEIAAKAAKPYRHIPAIIYGLALTTALVAFARPTAKLLAPDDMSGVIIAIETGRSMRAIDIEPNRLVASQEAAKKIIAMLPKTIKVGIATFSNYGTINTPLTLDRKKLNESIDSLSLGDGYSFTYGIQAGLDVLPESTEEDPPGAIIIFSHGHDRSGNNPITIANEAAKRNIKVHTIGVGTHGNNFSEDILKTVADITDGQYYPIFSVGDLSNAQLKLGQIIALRPKTTEVTAIVTLVAGLLLVASLLFSTWRRIV